MYNKIKTLVKSRELPLMYINGNDEVVMITWDAEYEAYKTITYQHNHWMRTNYYYADGTVEELYNRYE